MKPLFYTFAIAIALLLGPCSIGELPQQYELAVVIDRVEGTCLALRVDPVQMAHQDLRAVGSRDVCKIQAGFHTMSRDRARALSRKGTRTITKLADDYAFTYAPYIQAALRDVGHSYCQVANWLTRERIPA
jgi:hypothetical protein